MTRTIFSVAKEAHKSAAHHYPLTLHLLILDPNYLRINLVMSSLALSKGFLLPRMRSASGVK